MRVINLQYLYHSVPKTYAQRVCKDFAQLGMLLTFFFKFGSKSEQVHGGSLSFLPRAIPVLAMVIRTLEIRLALPTTVVTAISSYPLSPHRTS